MSCGTGATGTKSSLRWVARAASTYLTRPAAFVRFCGTGRQRCAAQPAAAVPCFSAAPGEHQRRASAALPPHLQVRLGAYEEDGGQYEARSTLLTLAHPGYFGVHESDNDIAIILLNRPSTLKPIERAKRAWLAAAALPAPIPLRLLSSLPPAGA